MSSSKDVVGGWEAVAAEIEDDGSLSQQQDEIENARAADTTTTTDTPRSDSPWEQVDTAAVPEEESEETPTPRAGTTSSGGHAGVDEDEDEDEDEESQEDSEHRAAGELLSSLLDSEVHPDPTVSMEPQSIDEEQELLVADPSLTEMLEDGHIQVDKSSSDEKAAVAATSSSKEEEEQDVASEQNPWLRAPSFGEEPGSVPAPGASSSGAETDENNTQAAEESRDPSLSSLLDDGDIQVDKRSSSDEKVAASSSKEEEEEEKVTNENPLGSVPTVASSAEKEANAQAERAEESSKEERQEEAVASEAPSGGEEPSSVPAAASSTETDERAQEITVEESGDQDGQALDELKAEEAADSTPTEAEQVNGSPDDKRAASSSKEEGRKEEEKEEEQVASEGPSVGESSSVPAVARIAETDESPQVEAVEMASDKDGKTLDELKAEQAGVSAPEEAEQVNPFLTGSPPTQDSPPAEAAPSSVAMASTTSQASPQPWPWYDPVASLARNLTAALNVHQQSEEVSKSAPEATQDPLASVSMDYSAMTEDDDDDDEEQQQDSKLQQQRRLKMPETLMARTRSRADVDTPMVMSPMYSPGAGDATGHMIRIDEDEEVRNFKTHVAKKRVRVVQLLVFGLIGLMLGFFGGLFVQGTCHFATARVWVGNNDQAFDMHYGLWKYTPMDSVFQGYKYCADYDGYSERAPYVARVCGCIALVAGFFSMAVLWTYLISGRASLVFWEWAIRMSVVAGFFQIVTLSYFLGGICRTDSCRLGPGSIISLVATVAWFLLAYELHYNRPISEYVPEVQPSSTDDSNFVKHLELSDFQQGASDYVDRLKGTARVGEERPSLNQAQRYNDHRSDMMSDVASVRSFTSSAFKSPTPSVSGYRPPPPIT